MVEDNPRFIEDAAKNALETTVESRPKNVVKDETTMNSNEAQDYGGSICPSVNTTNTKSDVAPMSKGSIVDSSTKADAATSEVVSEAKNAEKVEKSWIEESILPETVSSNYENISLDPKDREKNAFHVETTSKNIENIDSRPAIEDSKSLLDIVNNSEQVKNIADLSVEDNRWSNLGENKDEASIEDSCETQPAFSDSKISDILRNSSLSVKAVDNSSSRGVSTLSEDSRLVKIPLPTSSINLMHSNAQFLNKSRNFLNFITEKSTNIMEKTLLPQNIAVRYNSLLKYSDAGNTLEKKHCEETKNQPDAHLPSVLKQESPARSQEPLKHPKNVVEAVNIRNEDPTHLGSVDISPEIGIVEELDSQPPEDGSNFNLASTKREVSSSDLEIGCISYNNEGAQTKRSSDDEESRDSMATEDEIVSTDKSDSLLRNPVYLTLVRDYAKVREEKLKLEDRVKHLEERNRILEAQNSSELLNAQLETLEKTVEKLSGDLRLANANQEELGREYSAANKERESMVMKYAVSEKQLIDTQRAREYAERRFKEIAKDHELLQNKLRQAQNERTRICGILDTKCRELTDSQKELERFKEDVNVRDVKLKWTQTKLKTEMEVHKETQQKLDKATARINDMKDECEQVRRESQDMIRKFHQSEENKAVSLDQQLKEQQARLILERHVTEDKEMLRIQLQKEVDLLKNRQQALIEENNTLSLKIQDLEKDRLAYERKLSDLKIVTDQRQKEIVDLSAKVSHLETLKLQLIHKEQCLASNEAEVERLRQVNQELQVDMDCCRQREAHMLDFTQKLTDKNVRLQSEFTAVEAKTAQLEQEQGPLRLGIAELTAKVSSLESDLAHEKKKRLEECEILARHLAEQTQLAEKLSEKFEDSQGEIAVLRRKQQISVKEMSRELQQCRKRLETYESASPSNSLDPTSRTGSNTSLNTGEAFNGTSDHNVNGEHTIHSAELDRQSLIERILKMQKINVRRAEKLDFLEEHSRTLTAELQKKTKIIQNYILHENFDAMGSNERDRHKAELARHGGIMASVYNHRVSDDNMTLELSLEINQKLQAVLEDALLKNITLKDNIDTLGEEIARLIMKNQQLVQQKAQ